MDYEKKYKKALEHIKECVPDENGFITIYPQEVFPELRKSEDEKIRKELIFYLRHQHSISENFEDIGKWIAWLEKKGELVENNMLLPFKEYDNLMDSINKKKKEGYEAGYKQGLIDSKSEHKIEPKFKVGDTIRLKDSSAEYTITDIYDGCYHGRGWSLDIASADESGDYELVGRKADGWSEEDEEMIKGLNKCLDELEEENGWLYTYVDGKSVKLCKVRNWLKSLKDRYTWKPSNEQMEALANALSLAKNCGEECAFDLRTLHEQLKKLREE